MKIINSKDNKEIKYLLKIYTDKKFRYSEKAFIVEGYNLVNEALKAKIVKNIYLLKEDDRYPDSTIITKELMNKICDSITPQGIIALCEMKLNDKKGDKILYLDNLQDPANLGALMRSARAFDFDTIILNNSVDIFNPKTLRSSEGNIFNLNFIKEDIMSLKKDGYTILGTNMNSEKLEEFNLKMDKIVLILGNEGNGVNKELLDLCDHIITISMSRLTESLNVAVAGAIIMHHLKYNLTK
ncbi:MAG: RNA methyltransferase [Gammaproteobacteria bacterium]|nr:RNA methyltransferase [Gammaproteobacteria bacterium]